LEPEAIDVWALGLLSVQKNIRYKWSTPVSTGSRFVSKAAGTEMESQKMYYIYK
jgi:hypothetical protein